MGDPFFVDSGIMYMIGKMMEVFCMKEVCIEVKDLYKYFADDEAEKLCDQLLIIDQGKVITQGTPVKLIEKHFEEDTIEFENPSFIKEEIGALVSLESVSGQKLSEDENIILYTMDAVKTIADLLAFSEKAGKPIKNLNLRKPTLEDLFIKLTGKKIRE
jgi:ABC-2 type transport system ATP-binding protein